MDTAAILQRTETGLETIKSKSVKLTQSERLILIVVDGVTSYGALREKVWALSTERFTRALNTLLDKNLIYEVLLPDLNQEPEELDSTIVDRFLQQDPLDPVTIISMDPEDHFGSDLIAEMGHVLPPAVSTPSTGDPIVSTAPDLPYVSHAAAPSVDGDGTGGGALNAASIDHEDSGAETPPDTALSSPQESALPDMQVFPIAALAPEGNPAIQRSGCPDHATAESDIASEPSKVPEPRRKPATINASMGHHETHRGRSRTSSHRSTRDFRAAPAASATRKWSGDLLRLCSWTGFITGVVFLMVAIVRYYGTAV